MAERFIQSHIKNLPLFERLTPQQLPEVAEAFQVLRLEPGNPLFQQGQSSQGYFVFVSGRGVLTQRGADGQERTVGVVEAGQSINESALFTDAVENASLRAAEPSIVLYLSRQRFASLLSHYPDIRAAMQPHPSRAVTAKQFDGQRDNENVIARLRRHGWSYARFMWLPTIIAVGLISLGIASQSVPVALGLIGLAAVILGGFGLYFYFEWRDDYVFVTDQRVVCIWSTTFPLRSVISEIPIGNVLEVNTDISPFDPFARIFDYGTVSIKTAGEAGNIELQFMPKPQQLQTLIFTSRDRYQQSLELQNRNAIRAEVDKSLGQNVTMAAGAASASAMQSVEQASWSPIQSKFIKPDGEIVYRKHFIVWFKHVFLPMAVLLLGIVLLGVTVFQPTVLSGVSVLLSFVVLLVGAIWFYLADWDWRHDMYIVSDETITLIHQRPLWLQNQTDKILLSQVNNVVSLTSGFFSTLFDIGDVQISLVGADQASVKVFQGVQNPREVQAEISRRQARARALKEQGEADRQRQMIGDYLSVYHENIAPKLDAAQAVPPAPQSPPPLPEAEPPPPPLQDGTRPPGVPRVRPDEPPR
jgi:hypothetical protein